MDFPVTLPSYFDVNLSPILMGLMIHVLLVNSRSPSLVTVNSSVDGERIQSKVLILCSSSTFSFLFTVSLYYLRFKRI